MPLVFVHGVNTRSTDEDYPRSVAARRTLFEHIVSPEMVKRGFPAFTVEPDIYWGDLGVTFAWGLRAIPATVVLQSLGAPAGTIPNLDLMQLVSESTPVTGQIEELGPQQPLVAAAKKDPSELVRAIFSPEAEPFAPSDVRPPKAPLDKVASEKATAQGEHLGLMLIAVEDVAIKVAATPELIQGSTDDEVTKKIEQLIEQQYRILAQPRLDVEAQDSNEALGRFGDAIGWTSQHLRKAVEAAKKTAGFAVAETQRGATLVAMKELRQGVSRRALRFLGDVFVYLHHGRTSPAIYDRVRDGVLSLNGRKNDSGAREPFIVVTHSFGSEILYDLLTTGALDKLEIDLWVTVGAQTSLFAEMRLFSGMAPLPADTSNYSLGRPANVRKWVNFYDAADALSYLHEPVFGSQAVKDIQVRARANLTNAHGHYFVDPQFYERIRAEI